MKKRKSVETLMASRAKEDVLELPLPRLAVKRPVVSAGALAVGLAMLSCFIPGMAEADTLFVSGGGGGHGSSGIASNGGPWAGKGRYNQAGGAYVGISEGGMDPGNTGSDEFGSTEFAYGRVATGISSLLGYISANAEDGTNSIDWPRWIAGGRAVLEMSHISDYDLVVTSGVNGINFMGDNTSGGSATLVVHGVATTDVLRVVGLSGDTDGKAFVQIGTLRGTNGASPAEYMFQKAGPSLLAIDIGTLDATLKDVNLAADRTDASDVRINTLELGGGKTFTVLRSNSGNFTVNNYTIRGSATYADPNGLDARNKALNFYVPTDMTSGQTMLTVTGGRANINGATIRVGIDGASTLLNAGEHLVLIRAPGLDGTPDNAAHDGEGMLEGILGVTLRIPFEIAPCASDLNTLCATVTSGVELNPGGGAGPVTDEPLTQGTLSGAAFLTGGGDFLAGQAFPAVREQRRLKARGWQVFAALGGEDFRHKTGSHIDTEGFHLVTGLAGSHRDADRETTVGAFIETGEGRYDSTHRLARSRGDLRYKGAGLIGELAFDDGLALEASLRIGKAYNDAHSRDPLTPDFYPKYKTNGGYVGAHVGIGQKFAVNPSLTLEPYAQFLWLRQEGEKITDSAHLPSGERLRLEAKFKAVESQRLRLGIKAEQAFSETLTGYAGAAIEREFDGKVRSKARLFVNETPFELASGTPSLKGTTGVFELGLTMKPSDNWPLTVDFGVQGHVGKREGVSGNVTVRYAF